MLNIPIMPVKEMIKLSFHNYQPVCRRRLKLIITIGVPREPVSPFLGSRGDVDKYGIPMLGVVNIEKTDSAASRSSRFYCMNLISRSHILLEIDS